MLADSKWKCKACGCPIPYNPDYDMSNVLCSTCQCYYNSDRLLRGYRWVKHPAVNPVMTITGTWEPVKISQPEAEAEAEAKKPIKKSSKGKTGK